jgi:hypothetical protein
LCYKQNKKSRRGEGTNRNLGTDDGNSEAEEKFVGNCKAQTTNVPAPRCPREQFYKFERKRKECKKFHEMVDFFPLVREENQQTLKQQFNQPTKKKKKESLSTPRTLPGGS